MWPGKSDIDQLSLIIRSLGPLTKQQFRILTTRKLYDNVDVENIVIKSSHELTDPIDDKLAAHTDSKGADFVQECLRIDANMRPSAGALMKHAYLNHTRIPTLIDHQQSTPSKRWNDNYNGHYKRTSYNQSTNVTKNTSVGQLLTINNNRMTTASNGNSSATGHQLKLSPNKRAMPQVNLTPRRSLGKVLDLKPLNDTTLSKGSNIPIDISSSTHQQQKAIRLNNNNSNSNKDIFTNNNNNKRAIDSNSNNNGNSNIKATSHNSNTGVGKFNSYNAPMGAGYAKVVKPVVAGAGKGVEANGRKFGIIDERQDDNNNYNKPASMIPVGISSSGSNNNKANGNKNSNSNKVTLPSI
ncbi:hypothetical protein GZH46_01775, partial [Fragariocoptes setiger]